MSWNRLRTALRIVLLTLLASMPIHFGHAQDGSRLHLSDADLSNFPLVSLDAQVLDAAGFRVEGIRQDEFIIEEDGDSINSLSLAEETVGSTLIFAINTNAELRIRDTQGRSRFNQAKTALLEWWTQTDFSLLGIDDLTLLTTETVLIQHGDSMAQLASQLDAFLPAFEEVDTGYELLFNALDYVNTLEPDAAKPSSLIFVTTLLRQPRDIPLTNIITRARSTETAIFPVLMGETTAEDQPELEILLRLAEETGGYLTRFEQAKGFGDLADLLLSQRQQYRLTYRSAAAESGPHEIRVKIGEDGPTATTSYVLQIEPAEVTLLDLPPGIERRSEDPSLPLEDLPPTSTEVKFGFRFPDGYVRPIVASRLIVDGETVSRSSEPPFNVLEWDLRPILTNSDHSIQIAITDSLGLEGISPPFTIPIQVQLPPRGLIAIRPALGSLLLALAVLLAGILLSVFLLTSRRSTARDQQGGSTSTPALLRRAALQRELPEDPPEAFLVPLDSSDEYIPLVGTDTILGRDPSHAAVPIEDASVERMHARLIRQADGEYLIRDQGTTAGTWINFKEVPASGQRLRHGDLVHLGAAAFRFELASPPPPRPIRVEPAIDRPESRVSKGDQNS